MVSALVGMAVGVSVSVIAATILRGAKRQNPILSLLLVLVLYSATDLIAMLQIGAQYLIWWYKRSVPSEVERIWRRAMIAQIWRFRAIWAIVHVVGMGEEEKDRLRLNAAFGGPMVVWRLWDRWRPHVRQQASRFRVALLEAIVCGALGALIGHLLF